MNYERSQARRIALQSLYQLDVQGSEYIVDNALGEFINEASSDPKVREMAYFMARSAWLFHDQADLWIGRLAEKWSIARMATVDRNILRLAAWELVNYPQTPPKVVIDEALNIAKEFSTAESAAFINGLLDSLLREHLTLTGKMLDGEGKTVERAPETP
jgi:N utilization substance protein B